MLIFEVKFNFKYFHSYALHFISNNATFFFLVFWILWKMNITFEHAADKKGAQTVC